MTVTTDISYLDHAELYKTEKPYEANYHAEGFAYSNFKTNLVKDVRISDMRAAKHAFWKDGFEVVRFACSMTYDDWADQSAVQSKYCTELGEFLLSQLGASAVQAFEAVVRRRHISFPDGRYDHNIRGQPAMRPHVDASPTQTQERVDFLAAGTQFENWKGGWMFVNTWKPLRGPLRDWPLALCAPQSVKDDDLIAADNVREDEFAENQLLRAGEGHEWWYLKDQEASEIMLFRQADSDGNRGVPHVAIRLPESEEDVQARESIEVRYIAWFEGQLPKEGWR